MDRSIQFLAMGAFLILGVSHVLQPRAWGKFFAALHRQGEVGSFAVAFLSLSIGLPIVAFHQVWTGIPLVLTVLGWLHVTKAALYFCFPALGLRGMSLALARPERLAWAGGGLIGVSALLAYHLWA